mmetsp:Transcript_3119/g.7052  ORF Transcript_3119/g.7052 Transcript_3119/m.7052 type:complete len:660 (-) Transcript_3119:273-2252(-)
MLVPACAGAEGQERPPWILLAPLGVLVRDGRLEQPKKERRWFCRSRLELGVELAADEVGVAMQLEDLHALPRDVASDELHTALLQLLDVIDVDFVPVSVPLVESSRAVVELRRLALGVLEHSAPRAETHGAAHVSARHLGHEDDELVRRLLVELGRVRGGVPEDRARELNHSHLEAEADAEVWHAVLARVLGSGKLPLHRADAEAARHHHAVDLLERGPRLFVLGQVDLLMLVVQLRRVDPLDDQLVLDGEGGVRERFRHGEVRVGELGVLAHHRDGHRHSERIDELREGDPLRERARLDALPGRRQVKAVKEARGDALVVEQQRHAVDIRHVMHADAVLRRHVAKERQLMLRRGREGLPGAADEEVRREAHRPQLLHRVLRRLRLLLADDADHRHERHVQEAHVLSADAELELTERLDERHRLDVAHCAAQLDDAHVRVARQAVCRDVRNSLDPLHDRVRQMWDNLHGLAKVVSLALSLEACLVDLSRRDVVVAGERDANEALVVSQVQIDLAAVIQGEDLAVLEGRHGARVDVEVRVDLHRRDPVTRALEEHTQGRRSHAFPEPRNHSACHDHVLHGQPRLCRRDATAAMKGRRVPAHAAARRRGDFSGGFLGVGERDGEGCDVRFSRLGIAACHSQRAAGLPRERVRHQRRQRRAR